MRFKDFLIERVGPTAKAGITFNVTIPVDSPLYDNSSDTESFVESLKKAADSLSTAVSDEVKVAKKPGAHSRSAWTILPRDGSNSWAHAIQIVAPLSPVAIAARDITVVSKWIEDNGLRTTDSDLAMIAIGVSGIEERLDPVKLVMFMDGASAASAFSNQNRKYTPSQIEILAHKVKTTGKLPDSASDLVKAAERYLGKRAEGQTNFENMEDGVIEFKVAAGAGYEHDVDQIKKKINLLSRAVEIAVDPVQSRGEYVQKLMTLFNPDGEQVLPVTGNDKKLPPELKRLYMYDPEILSGWKLYSAEAEHGSPRIQLLVLINTAMKAAKKQNSSLTIDEKSFFKKLIRQTALQGSDADEYFGHDHLTRLRFKTDFGV